MKVLDTILVPVDFTERSLNALAVAIVLSQQQQASLHLLYIRNLEAVQANGVNEQLVLLIGWAS